MTSGEPIEGSVQPPYRTDDAAILAAFRECLDWTDEEVLHYASCDRCYPLGGDMEWYCDDSPRERRRSESGKSHWSRGEPVRPQPPLPAGLRRASS